MSKSAAGNPANPKAAAKSTWRVVDIVVASVLAVAVGVIFWLWSAGYGLISALTVAFPPLVALYGGGWLIAGVLGALVIRKPGAALYCELVAATVEGLLGTHFGFTVLLSGLVQGLGAEAIFALFRYRKFTLPVALLAGALSGVALGLNDSLISNVAWAFEWKALYVVLAAVSGAVIAGLLSWLAVRGLARTGALANLPSRGAAAESVV
ncbi:hypothetical protein AOC05_14480 [Arthrobacter alpinus]|uniref:Energy-coupling factor transport system substrate-specific component n=1 Tax=Arthrobacter alpinus TaxID=656366 RepID=A0A0M3UGK2_9MICC|nr:MULTISPECIES: ECF transporter S component [Arthrobacter]ALE93255.1 hypothetical protein AOC05_14480 [Arthrobacter alpinus]